jgi:hypothetical protein
MLKVINAATQVFTGENTNCLIKTAEYCVIEVDSELALIFFGSDSLPDWLDNFAFFMVNVDSFPKGWHNQAVIAFKDLIDYPIKYVIGYSRGAAIALIYSYYFNIQAICFSTPRVSKILKYWTIKPVIIGCLNDPIRLVPFFYQMPGNYIAVYVDRGGHFWHEGKFDTAVKIALLEN